MSKDILVMPKAPRPKMNKIPKIISFIKLIEVDDDSDSDQEKSTSINYTKKCAKMKDDDPYLSDDRYEDSFDEEFGECETNPDSGKANINQED